MRVLSSAKRLANIDCRQAAALCLSEVVKGASLSQQIPLWEPQVIQRDRALFRQLCYGVLRHYPRLEAYAKQLLRKPFKEKDTDILQLILMGIYQLSETRIPDHAAVSATVAVTKPLKKAWAKNLVNGVLRQWQRSHESLKLKHTLAEQSAHPEWLYQRLANAWPEQFENIIAANNEQAPMCLRVNQGLQSRDDYLQLLAQADIRATACEFASQGLRLSQAAAVDELPGFAEGWVSVQDESPQLAAQLLELAPAMRVLDACCAPGGKTCHIAETEPALSELVAVDIDAQRLARVADNLQRLQLQANLHCADLADLEAWWHGQPFDRILYDAPCSATGVIRRNPDIKLHRRDSDIAALCELQLSLLTALWQTLKPGGRLLYATCSVLPEENEHLIAQFCRQQADVQHLVIEAEWGEQRPFGRQIFPKLGLHDGFYYALLLKNE